MDEGQEAPKANNIALIPPTRKWEDYTNSTLKNPEGFEPECLTVRQHD